MATVKKRLEHTGSRLNGEMSRSEQRELRKHVVLMHAMFFSLRDAVQEHSDGKRIMDRAEKLREKPVYWS